MVTAEMRNSDFGMRNESLAVANPGLVSNPHSEIRIPHSHLVRPGGRLHYRDVGAGDPVVFVHGNPTWGVYFRSLVSELSRDHRCVVPDHLGCGLSDKPTADQYDFRLNSRIDDLDALLEHCRVGDRVTLVVHDWGGMIGLGWAARHPGRLKRLVAGNTAAFPLPAAKRLPRGLWLGRNTRLGAWLILHRNAFCRAAARWCVTRNPLPPEVRDLYLAPYDTPAHRLAVLRFVQTIPLRDADPGMDIVKRTAAYVDTLRDVPTLLLWGLRDWVFDRHFLAEWQRRLPHAEAHTWADCGHYLLEDAPDEVVPKVRDFLARHPLSAT
jgi:haloalkane dehalogenase